MKPAILVTSHPNTRKKERILKDFGNFISQYGIDQYLFTNFPASKESQQEFKEAHFLNYNPKGPWLGKVWSKFPDFKLQHNKAILNWCYSGTNLILEGVKYLKSKGYSHVIMLMYDIEPSFPKVQNFINYSLETLNTKKGIFFNYLPDWGDSLSTSVFSSEVNFFLNIFEKAQNDYLNKCTNGLCEPYWYDYLTPHKNDIEILSYNKSLKTVYNSIEEESSIIEDNNYFLGYIRSKNKIGLILENFSYPFQIINENKFEIPYKLIKKGNRILIEFGSEIDNSYYIRYKDKVKFLFKDTPNFRIDFYFTNI